LRKRRLTTGEIREIFGRIEAGQASCSAAFSLGSDLPSAYFQHYGKSPVRQRRGRVSLTELVRQRSTNFFRSRRVRLVDVPASRASTRPGDEELCEAILDRSELELARGSYEAAAAFVQLAADFTVTTCSRSSRSWRIEQLLFELSRRLPPPLGGRQAQEKDGLLHVLTNSSASNPRASLVAQWLTTDTDHQHAVTLTHAAELEGTLASVAATSGATVTSLADAVDLPRRAAELRLIAQGYAATVLHTAPFDVVPALAFGAGPRGPVALMDAGLDGFRSDLWVANVLIISSESVLGVNPQFREVRPEHFAVLAPPIPPEPQKRSRMEILRSLDLSDASCAVLVLADVNSAVVADVIAKLAAALPGFEFLIADDFEDPNLAIGAEADPARTESRDLSRRGLWDAVDVVLDVARQLPSPLLLRAANRGLPVVVYRTRDEDLEMALHAHKELRPELLTARSDGELVEVLKELLEPETRNRKGAALQAIIGAGHRGATWRHAWSTIFDQLLAVERTIGRLPRSAPSENTEWRSERASREGEFRSCLIRQTQLLGGPFARESDPTDELLGQMIDWVIELVDAHDAIDGSESARKLLAMECRRRTAYQDLGAADARLAELSAAHAELRARADAILGLRSYKIAQGVAAIAKRVRRGTKS
jgi:hypothetical protein